MNVKDIQSAPNSHLIFSTVITDVTLYDASGSLVPLQGEAQLCFSTTQNSGSVSVSIFCEGLLGKYLLLH